MLLASFLIAVMEIFLLISTVGLIFSALFRSSKGTVISMVSIAASTFGLVTSNDFQEQTKLKLLAAEEKVIHQNLMNIPEGRYILNHIVSADSAKVRFVLQLPGIAKRQVEVIAYDDSPIYWNEWQAEPAVPGDTLIIRDVWTSHNSGSTYTYNRTVQKLGPDDVGLGYISTEWLERQGWRN